MVFEGQHDRRLANDGDGFDKEDHDYVMVDADGDLETEIEDHLGQQHGQQHSEQQNSTIQPKETSGSNVSKSPWKQHFDRKSVPYYVHEETREARWKISDAADDAREQKFFSIAQSYVRAGIRTTTVDDMDDRKLRKIYSRQPSTVELGGVSHQPLWMQSEHLEEAYDKLVVSSILGFNDSTAERYAIKDILDVLNLDESYSSRHKAKYSECCGVVDIGAPGLPREMDFDDISESGDDDATMEDIASKFLKLDHSKLDKTSAANKNKLDIKNKDLKTHRPKNERIHSSTGITAQRRLMKDLHRLQKDAFPGATGAPEDDDIRFWRAVIFGPDDTPWEGGVFQMTMEFSETYPNEPPLVRFQSKMFHPNIFDDGCICLDILQDRWSPAYDVWAILVSIQSLLCDPNLEPAADKEASRMYVEDRREYNRRVRDIVAQSWE